MVHGIIVHAKKEATATKPHVTRLKKTLEEEGRAPLLLVLPPVVSEGWELLLVLLGDPERELLELPVGLELAGGARERGDETINYVNDENEPRENLLPATLTSNRGEMA